MTHAVGPKGQVVIPKAMRDAIGLRPGDRVEFELEQGTVRVAASRVVRARKGAFRGHELVAGLEADRRSEPR